MYWYKLFIFYSLFFITACQPATSPPPKSAEREANYTVEVTAVKSQILTKTESYTGDVKARRSVRIFTQEAGKIITLPYYEGDSVKTGSVLLQLDDALLKAQLNKMQATYHQVQVNSKRVHLLTAKKMIAEEEALRAETEEEIAKADVELLTTRLSYTQITVPFHGIVTARLVELGDIVTANAHIYTVIDPNSLFIEVSLPEYAATQLKLQDKATIRIDALGTSTWQGKISRLHPTIDLNTRLSKVEITLNSPPNGLKIGQFARITLDTLLQPKLAIPYAGLRRDREGEFVFLITPDKRTKRQAVRSGLRLADLVEITDGLTEGQLIVTRGFLGLQPDKIVQIAHP
jgi:RND family efflux transporter MFP subunit